MSPEARHRSRIRTPVLAVTAIAWAVLLADHLVPSPPGPGMGHGGMGPRHDMAGMTLASPVGTAGRALMLTAMMGPLLIPALRHVHARSLPRNRWPAMTLLIAGCAATWWAVAAALQQAAAFSAARAPAAPLLFGLLAALAWQASPAKQRCLNRHHAHPPIAAFGPAAWLDPLRYGVTHALWCAGSCWALMLLPLLATGLTGGTHQHATAAGLALMAAVSAWIWAESFTDPAAPRWRLRAPAKAARIVARRP